MSKDLYKLLIVMLKYIPMIISLCYLANTITAYVGIDIPVSDFQLLMLHSIITGISLFIILFLYLKVNGAKVNKKIQMQ